MYHTKSANVSQQGHIINSTNYTHTHTHTQVIYLIHLFQILLAISGSCDKTDANYNTRIPIENKILNVT